MHAGMARALELLRNEAPREVVTDFLKWVNTQLMPQMDYFVNESDLGMHGAWMLTLEAWVSFILCVNRGYI